MGEYFFYNSYIFRSKVVFYMLSMAGRVFQLSVSDLRVIENF